MTAWQIAIETSGRQGSVALLEENRPVRQIVLPAQQRTAQSLAPAVAELLSVPPRGRRDIALVSVAVGPGSFTGIRIGVTAAKSLAYALRVPVAPCDTLAAVVEQVRGEIEGLPDQQIDAAINAYRGQVYCRRETRDGRLVIASTAKDRSDWLASLPTDRSATAALPDPAATLLLAGDAWAKVHLAGEAEQMFGREQASAGEWRNGSAALADARLWQPTASTVGSLGWQIYNRGEASDPLRLLPVYLRASAAEEKQQTLSS